MEAKIPGAKLDIAKIWVGIDTQQLAGHNSLTQLGIRIHSATPNACGAERTFSPFGHIHTKVRNRLKPKKVHKMALVATDVQRLECELAPPPDLSQKRKLDEPPTLITPAIVDVEDSMTARTGTLVRTTLTPLQVHLYPRP